MKPAHTSFINIKGAVNNKEYYERITPEKNSQILANRSVDHAIQNMRKKSRERMESIRERLEMKSIEGMFV